MVKKSENPKKKFQFFFYFFFLPGKKPYSLSFPILEGRDSTRALQFTLF